MNVITLNIAYTVRTDGNKEQVFDSLKSKLESLSECSFKGACYEGLSVELLAPPPGDRRE